MMKKQIFDHKWGELEKAMGSWAKGTNRTQPYVHEAILETQGFCLACLTQAPPKKSSLAQRLFVMA